LWPYTGTLRLKEGFFRLEVYKRIGISQIEAYERVGKTVVEVLKSLKLKQTHSLMDVSGLMFSQ